MQDNQEGDTDKNRALAKMKLEATSQQFKLLKKMLKYEAATTMANAEQRDPGVHAVIKDAECV